MKVELSQFIVRGDKIVHLPTGAEFWKGDEDVGLLEHPAATNRLSIPSCQEADTARCTALVLSIGQLQ